jgi:hypothetical protein
LLLIGFILRQVTSRRTAKKIFEEEMLIAKGAKEV